MFVLAGTNCFVFGNTVQSGVTKGGCLHEIISGNPHTHFLMFHGRLSDILAALPFLALTVYCGSHAVCRPTQAEFNRTIRSILARYINNGLLVTTQACR